MVIFNTTDTLAIKLTANVTTNQLQCYSVFTNSTGNKLNKIFTTNQQERVAVLDSPIVNNRPCELLYLNVFNSDTTTKTILLQINTYTINRFTLDANECFIYNKNEFIILDATGLRK